jgi:hypothetical protein
MTFSVWVTGADTAAVGAVADELARRLAAREVVHEVLDRETPGIGAFGPDDAPRAAAFAAGVLARHGIATIVAVPTPRRAARDGARSVLGCMIEVHVRGGGTASPAYEPAERAEVEVDVDDVARAADRVVQTLEVLERLPRTDDRAYSEREEREVIRRLKAFGYL